MNEFQKIQGEVEGWVHREQTAVNALFKRIEPLMAEAEPVIKDISQVAATVAAAAEGPAGVLPAALLAGLSTYLGKAATDAGAVDAFFKANESAPIPNMLHNAAVVAVANTPKAVGADISDIDTAVQIVYSTVKQKLAL